MPPSLSPAVSTSSSSVRSVTASPPTSNGVVHGSVHSSARGSVPGRAAGASGPAPANGGGAAPTLLAKKVKGIVEQRIDLRRRMCDFSRQLLRSRDLDLADVRIVVANAMIGVREAITGMNPDDRTTILRQVFDGLGDGLAQVAQAQTLVEARTSARVGDLSQRLRGMEQSFLETCLSASETFTDPIKRELRSMVNHAKLSGTRIGPAARSAVEVLDERLAAGGSSIGKRAAGAMVPAVETPRRRKAVKSR